MYVKIYLEDAELLKFLAGEPCRGSFVSWAETHRYNEVLVPRERVQVEEKGGLGAIFGPGLIAHITG